MIRTKICGLTEIDTAVAAALAGADYLGIVMAPSPRRITPDKALEIASAVHCLPSPPEIVGVFVNSPAEEVNSLAETCRLDRIQLSGDETWEYCRELKKPVIKAIHISGQSRAEEIMEDMQEGYRLLSGTSLVCLLDTWSESARGGTGRSFDWRLAGEIAAKFPVFIAGGLTPANIENLVQELRPWGVDVSSGVETEGKKDLRKIREFIRRSKGL
ncbi:MAG: phosphoribosylanthranilate isomerase [Dehalococcoidales bacterium]|nr:phosphoribosylanthranilate isomerase [Dehalococcoidales bacterium]